MSKYSKPILLCIYIFSILRLSLLLNSIYAHSITVEIEADHECSTRLSQNNSSDAHQTNLLQLLNVLADEPLSTRLLASQFKRILTSADGDDWNAVKLRCHRYGTTPLAGGHKRRIFVGSLLADDSWLTILSSAIESYAIYHYFVFIESNQTQNLSPREFRFTENSPFHKLLTGGIFGPETIVHVKRHIWESFNFSNDDSMMREFAQRERILEFWIQNGMTPNDIGIIQDADETFSRDFLLAAQSCDFPELRSDTDCAKSRLVAKGMFFIGSFSCMRCCGWFKPQMLIGHCFERIGNSTGIPSYPLGATNDRLPGYGWNDDFSKIPQGPFPLYKIQDLVRPGGTIYYPYNNMTNPNAYHFQNFFNTPDNYRFKYGTYGHANANAFNVSFEKLNRLVEMMINCARNIPQLHVQSMSQQHLFAPASFAETDFITARQQEILGFLDNNP